MEFNTAIFYDIENLIGGYSKADMLSCLSLKDIYNEILSKDIGKIALQRAYANWSDPRLSILRTDIVELGVDPIQMFGFGLGPQKNASDIQLAIDAIDIALTRENIKIFIIVSGDGGFSALAKKLHEYGYMVIGCAFKRTTNKVLEAVCDDFIWIEEPVVFKSEFTDPILIEYSKKFKPITIDNKERIFEEAIEILNFLSSNKNSSYLLNGSGLNISIFSQALSYRIRDFNFLKLGFTKFVDFIRFVSKETNIKLVHKEPSEYRLLYKNAILKGFEDVEPIFELNEIHTVENYKALLSKGTPIFRLPRMEVVSTILKHLAENRERYQNMLLSDMIDNLSQEHREYDYNEIKGCMLSLVSSGCFLRKPEEAKLSEQKLSFIPTSAQEATTILKGAMYHKLKNLLEDVKDDTFKEIFK